MDTRLTRAARLALALASTAWLAAGCTPPSADDACAASEARARRCETPSPTTCELGLERTRCVGFASQQRPEYLAAVTACETPDVACGPAGDAALSQCLIEQIASLPPTDAQRHAIGLACEACPSIAQDGEDDDAGCIAALTSVPLGNVGEPTQPRYLLRSIDDATAAAFAHCLEQAPGRGTCALETVCLLAALPSLAADDGASCGG